MLNDHEKRVDNAERKCAMHIEKFNLVDKDVAILKAKDK